MPIELLYIEDKLGITDGYMSVWDSLLFKAGFDRSNTRRMSLYRGLKHATLLRKHGQRKAPTWNPSAIGDIRNYIESVVDSQKPKAVLCADPASLCLLGIDPDIATLDNLRGGVYYPFRADPRIPMIITVPISSWHRKVKEKDLALANKGFTDQEEFTEYYSRQSNEESIVTIDAETGEPVTDEEEAPDTSDSDQMWYEPIAVPYGKFVLQADLNKAKRVINKGIGQHNPGRFKICWDKYDCEEAIDFCLTSHLIAKDIETIPHKKKQKSQTPFLMTVDAATGLQPDGTICSFAFPFVREKNPLSDLPDNFEHLYKACQRINDSPVPKTLHNGVYDATWYIRYNMPLRNYAYDSMSLWWARYPDMPRKLDFVSSILLDNYQYWKQGRKDTDMIRYMIYGMSDTQSTLLDTVILIQWCLQFPEMRRNFHYAHLRCLSGLGMSMPGMRVDFDVFREMHAELQVEADAALEKLRYLVDDSDFNPNSPAQKKDLFYGLLGARPRNAKGRYVAKSKGMTGASTGATPMRAIRTEHPIFKRVVDGVKDSLEPSKQISNVIGIEFLHGRFRTSYDGVATTTSRFASRADPFGYGTNAQNIRKKYRRLIRADKGCFLLDVDYSGADDVAVSYESEEEKKIELIESGKDIHSFNASQVFFTNWTYEQVVDGKKNHDPLVVHPITGIRQITKKTTHGCNYLMHALTLLMSAGRDAIVAAAKHLGYHEADKWTQEALLNFCEMLDANYRKFYKKFARAGDDSFYTVLKKELIDTGGFTTMFNYKQHFYASPDDDATLRAVAASSGQANTAGRINMAMVELDHGIRQLNLRDGRAPDAEEEALPVNARDFGCELRLQTHDSFTYNVNPEHPRWQEGVDRILHVMRRPVICKDRIVNFGIEGEVSIWWAGKEGIEVNHTAEILPWLDKMQTQGIGEISDTLPIAGNS